MDFPFEIPLPVALAVIAVLGYMAGRGARAKAAQEADKARRELRRAKVIAKELEQIAEGVRKHLATHHMNVARFKDRVSELSGQDKEAAWQQLCGEAEQILKPTLRLAEQIAKAYDEIRQQTNQLMTFSEVRTDPLTRVSNRRGLDETLDSMFALKDRYEEPFSMAIFDIDHFKQVNDKKGHLHGDRTLQAVARILDDSVRDTDIVARYGGEEFVVVMPQTTLDNACALCRASARQGRGGLGADDQRRRGHGAGRRQFPDRCCRVPTPRSIAARRPAAIASIATPAPTSSRST